MTDPLPNTTARKVSRAMRQDRNREARARHAQPPARPGAAAPAAPPVQAAALPPAPVVDERLAEERDGFRRQLEAARIQRDTAREENDRLRGLLEEAFGADAAQRADLRQTIRDTAQRLDTLRNERDAARAERDALAGGVAAKIDALGTVLGEKLVDLLAKVETLTERLAVLENGPKPGRKN